MLEFKDEWDLLANDLQNKEVKVQYMCYLDHLAGTIGALLGHKLGLNLDIDLREGRNSSGKSQITVTTMHQTKHSLLQHGGGDFGYGKDNKLSIEDKILESVFSKVSAECRNLKQEERQDDILADIVPELQKKPAKAVNAQTALTLACRRKQFVGADGVPRVDGEKNRLAGGALGKEQLFANNNELSIAFLPKNTSMIESQK